jgi:hypothetical protein
MRQTLTIFALVVSMVLIGSGYAYSGHKWSTATAQYYVNPINNDVTASAALAAVQLAADAWSNRPEAEFAFVYAGPTTGNVAINNGKNEVFFRQVTSGNIGQTFRWWNASGDLVDADIVLYDPSWRFYAGLTGCTGTGYYIEEITAHEFGHALGLDHSTVSQATMIAGASKCATFKHTLAPDDIAALAFVYPGTGEPPPPPQTPVLTAVGYLDGGVRKTDLAWTAGLEGTTVDMRRGGAVPVVVANNGAYTDLPPSTASPLKINYKVCQIGSTTICTNVASVTFQ